MKRKRSMALVFAAMLFAIGAMVFGFIQTPPGKAMVARTVSDMLSRSENLDVEIGTIEGWIPWDMQINHVSIGDAAGEWMTASQLGFRWVMRELLDGRIRLRYLNAGEVVWMRFPESIGNGKTNTSEAAAFRPMEVRLDGLTISQLRLEKELAGTELYYSIHSGGITMLDTGRISGEVSVGGDAVGTVYIDAVFSGRGDDRLALKAELDRMENPSFGLDRLSGVGEATLDRNGVEALVQADIEKDGESGSIETRLRYANQTLSLESFSFSRAGCALEGNAELRFGTKRIDAEIDASLLDAFTNRYHVAVAAAVAASNQTWAVELHELNVRGFDVATVGVSGSITPDTISLDAVLEEFGIGDLPFGWASNYRGRIGGNLMLEGTPKDPVLDADFAINGFGSSRNALDELPEMDFDIKVRVADGQLSLSTSGAEIDSGHIDLSLQMPCTLSLYPLAYGVEPGRMAGDLDARLDLGLLNSLAMFQNQFVQGNVEAKVEFTDAKPHGDLRIDNGRYEHYDWGVALDDLKADVEIVNDGFRVHNAEASDGGSGRVSLTGGMATNRLDMHLVAHEAHIIRRDEIDALVSGSVDVSGKPGRPEITGSLTIDRAEILLDNIPAPPPAVLADYDAEEEKTPDAAGGKKREPPPFGLKIYVDIPEQAFVVSSLIEAVLQGNLTISDAPNGVSVTGRIEPRRGFVNFIGKKFRFVDGSIRMTDAVPPEAFFDNLTAEYGRRDVTARLVLNGPVKDPRFRLESSPPLPQDEVLSHVLFNRDTSSISPYQAYQIAAAARQLSGGLSGPGFMYGIRQAIGVDTLELREADAADEASTVAAGKYLTSELYIEVNQTLESESQTGMMAEFELSRHFSVETYTGPKLRPGIGLNWRNDY